VSYARKVVVTLLVLGLWAAVVLTGALFGWWRQPIAPAGDAQAFMRAAIEMIEERNRGNVALVLVEDGMVRGEYYSATADSVDRNMVFPAASMSKWIAAWAVMRLVEEGKLDLDRPVEDYLTRWQLPPDQFDNRGVTARRLLSHTAGLTDGLGFGDYQRDEVVPTLEQSLANPRASSGEPAAIAVGTEPGSEWRYSGGGYLVLELLVEEVSGETFEAFTQGAILQPLGMTRSGYRYLGDIESASGSYDPEGHPVPTYRYASKAATAFATSAADMARFVLAQLPFVTDKPLSQATIEAMGEPHATSRGIDIWGLGTMLYAPSGNGGFILGHDGANEPAINTSVRVNPDTGDGIIVLTTGNRTLASLLGFHWVFWQTGLPDFLSIPGEIRRVTPVLLGGAFAILLMAVLVGRRRRRGEVPGILMEERPGA
jgi:CubicO group peptidase (beta-lactamase class C family)